MKKELQDKLVAAYPGIFQDVGGDPRQTCMAFGLCVGDGWYDIIDVACKAIVDHIEGSTPRPECDPVVAEQIKEKFGTLRWYARGGDAYTEGVVATAEAMSSRICEDCGNPGKMRTRGWLRTLCDACEGVFYKKR